MKSRIPSEAAIQAEMEQCGIDRLPAIRRLQQRAFLLTRQREARRADLDAALKASAKRQQAALRFITGYLQAKGYSPSFEEIGAAVGLLSKHSVQRLLNELEDSGAIRRIMGKRRAIEVVEHVKLPRAPDGAPLYFVPVGGAPC